MATIRETLTTTIASMVPRPAVNSILATLPEAASAEVGTLDLTAMRDLLGQVTTGLKLFGASSPATLDVVKRNITGGKACPPTKDVVRVTSDQDVIYVQRRCQAMTKGFFSGTDCVRLATAASELARNIYMYAKTGTMTLIMAEEGGKPVFTMHAEDQGPGIKNLEEILSGGYVSSTGLGKGLKGTKSLLDGMDIQSTPGKGTSIRGWKRSRQ